MPQNPTPKGDSSAWTTIKRKARSRGKGKGKSQANNTDAEAMQNDPEPVPPRTKDLRPVEALDAEYRRIKALFEEDDCCKQLRELMTSLVESNVVISKAINLGVGTFDPDEDRWISRRSTYVQAIAFLIMVEELGKGTDQKIKCIFQEPMFTESDKAFLASLGHEVAEHPAGLDEIDENSLFFGIHLYRGLYIKALAKHLPAIFVGTSYYVWDDINQTEGLENLKMIEDTYHMSQFPTDPYSQAFSNTRIFWRPASPKTSGDKDEETAKPGGEKEVEDVADKMGQQVQHD